jgi:hypothetical protein
MVGYLDLVSDFAKLLLEDFLIHEVILEGSVMEFAKRGYKNLLLPPESSSP